MFGLHNPWNFDRLMGLSLRTSAESVPWFAAALFAWLVIMAFCMLISFGRCAFKDPDSCGAFLVPDVISAGRYSPVSGALAFWGLFCTVTLLFFTIPGDGAGLLLFFYGLVYLHVYLLGCCLFDLLGCCLFGSARHLLAVFWSCHHLLVCIVRWISVFCRRLSSQCASECFQIA